MAYKINRSDGKDDYITIKKFLNFDEAYDFLNCILGEACCSDTDYVDDIHYNIIEI